MNSVYILPTGDEIRNGTVLDLDSAEIMAQVVAYYPQTKVVRMAPALDTEDCIMESIRDAVRECPDLIVLIGGSGGGHRYSKTLGKDYTHTALEQYLGEYAEHTIYGKNGHMWTRLLCGKKDQTVIINVPGPYVEAKAAFAAYLRAEAEGKTLEEVSRAMAKAVFEQYPAGTAEPV